MSFSKSSRLFCLFETRPRVLPLPTLLHLIVYLPQPGTAHFSCGLHRVATRNLPVVLCCPA